MASTTPHETEEQQPQHGGIADVWGIRALDIDAREPCLVQGAKMGASAFLAGSLYGGVAIYWRDTGEVKTRGRLRALRGTFSTIASYGGLFALVGATFGATQCAVRHARGVDDAYSPLIASCAAGAVMGARINGTAFGSFMGCALTTGLAALGQAFDWTLASPTTSSARLAAIRQRQLQSSPAASSSSPASSSSSSSADAE